LIRLLFLLVGRFLLGVSVGIGFVAAYIALFDCYQVAPPLLQSPPPDSARGVYLSAAFFFAGGTFMANAPMVLFPHTPQWMTRLLYAAPAILAGINYFIHRASYTTGTNEGVAGRGENGGNREESKLKYALLLMTLNATIGVPIVLAYSALIYEALGLSASEASLFSTVYPLLQLMFLLFMAHKCSSVPTKTLIIGGYSICLGFMLIAVLTHR